MPLLLGNDAVKFSRRSLSEITHFLIHSLSSLAEALRKCRGRDRHVDRRLLSRISDVSPRGCAFEKRINVVGFEMEIINSECIELAGSSIRGREKSDDVKD